MASLHGLMSTSRLYRRICAKSKHKPRSHAFLGECGTRSIPLTTCPQTVMFGWQLLMAEGRSIPLFFLAAAWVTLGWMQSRGGQLRFIPPIGRSGCKRRREKRNAYWALSTVYDDIVNALCLARY